MKRRHVLRSSAVGLVGLGGCLSIGESGTKSFPEVKVINANIRHDRLSFSASVVEEMNEKHPARLKLTLTCIDGPIELYLGGSPPFDDYWSSEHGETKIVIVPDSREYVEGRNGENSVPVQTPESPSGSCWKIDYTLISEDIALRVNLKTGQKISETYSILIDGAPCPESAEYRFSDQSGPIRQFTMQLS